VITTLDAGTARLVSREFRVRVHQRDLSAGIQPQDKMQVWAVSFDPTGDPGTLPIIVRAFWLRESRTVIAQYSLEEQVEWRGFWSAPNRVSFSGTEMRSIEARLPDLVVQALVRAGVEGVDGETGAVTVWGHRFGVAMNRNEAMGERAHHDWAIRRVLDLEMRLGGGASGTADPV